MGKILAKGLRAPQPVSSGREITIKVETHLLIIWARTVLRTTIFTVIFSCQDHPPLSNCCFTRAESFGVSQQNINEIDAVSKDRSSGARDF